jgi:hypothetical protein
MLEFYVQHRGFLNLLLVFAFACCIPFAVFLAIRKQRAGVPSTHPTEQSVRQHGLITALNEAGAIGIGIVWTILIYKGPSLTQLSLGARGISHWTMVLFYTMVWLSLSRVMIPEGSAGAKPAIIVRLIAYGFFFLGAIVGLNDW